MSEDLANLVGGFDLNPDLFNNPNGHRGSADIRMEMHEIYKIIRDRLEWVSGDFDSDAVCQNICVEIEKHLGTYPNVSGLSDKCPATAITPRRDATSEMVERVARAIFPDAFDREPGHDRGNCPECDGYEEHAMALARAAISVMREPTDEMLEAGSLVREPLSSRTDNTKSTWEAMIEEAMK